MNLTKMFFLTIFIAFLGFQPSLASSRDGRIEIINRGLYVIKRIKCWDTTGRRTHSSGRLLNRGRRHCEGRYLKVEQILSKQEKFERRFYRSLEGCTGFTRKLCIKARGTIFEPRFDTYCRSVNQPCF